MKWIDRVLVKLGFIDKIPDDDRINASTEDAARIHETAVSKLHQATQERFQSNALLRHSIDAAKERTKEFASFELNIRKGRRQHVRRRD